MVISRVTTSVAFMLFVTAAFLTDAKSAEVKVGVGKSGQATIWITGEIVPGDADRFSQSVRQANDSGKFVANVRLDSPGGNLLEGVKIAEAIRFGKTSTNVGRTAVCASACFLCSLPVRPRTRVMGPKSEFMELQEKTARKPLRQVPRQCRWRKSRKS